jgi:hypothetical protein
MNHAYSILCLKLHRDHNKKNTQDSNRSCDTVSIEQQKEQLGDQIYLKVVSEYPDTASKITGMLLDMDIERLREISEDDDMLMEKVGEAVQVLEEDSCGDGGHGASSQKNKELLQKQLNLELNLSNLQDKLDSLEDDLQKEIIGEELYKILFNLSPNHADKITGMLLEMNSNDLLETIANKELLQNRVQQAVEALGVNS